VSFTAKILVAMAAGIGVGAMFSAFSAELAPLSGLLVDGVLYALGQIFIRLLQMMVVPLVLVSLVCGVMSLGDVRALGRLGVKTITLYLLTTCIAIVISLLIATLVDPGRGFTLEGEAAYEERPAPSLVNVFIEMFPANPISALAEGQMLQIIVFALILGFSISVAGESGRRVGRVFTAFNDVIMRMVLLIIRTAPVGVFALVTVTFSTQGLDVFRPLAGYFLVVVCALLAHLLVTYTSLVRLAGLSARRFLGKVRALMTFAFSTS